MRTSGHFVQGEISINAAEVKVKKKWETGQDGSGKIMSQVVDKIVWIKMVANIFSAPSVNGV